MAVAALVLGIIGIVFSWLPIFGIPLAIVGLILGIVARKNAVNTSQPTGTATAGLVVSIIGVAISTLITVACFACAAKFDKKMKEDPQFRESVRQQQEEFRKSQQQNDKDFNDAFKNAVDHTQKPGPGATTVPAPAAPSGAMPAPLGDAPAAKPAPALPPSQPQK